MAFLCVYKKVYTKTYNGLSNSKWEVAELNIASLLESLSAGSFVATLVIILSLVEISPIKISPLKWLGKRLNKETLDKVEKIDKKLDEHIAQSYRTKILNFQDDILAGRAKTKEQWRETINAISLYEVYCEDNHIINGLCKEASEFLRGDYRERLKNKDFAPSLSIGGKHEQ